ncbi:U3 small nucleolar RNA-associated protein 18 homolog [Cimex lectularius]|uniref:U3 small nucleolar RNA-associated protein 18 homolog n=1 Tax=Cimex lectularius TaxID=79782 RepID=A0A8I6RLG2_CIMLE|nr:U3 small nucleolar RNA-associated protein 18 homolog [Cimex lectularius]
MEGGKGETAQKKRKHAGDGEKPRRKRKLNKMLDKEKERLEKLVLGDASFMLRNLGRTDCDSGVEDDGTADSDFSDTLASPRPPAWQDEDDLLPLTVEDVLRTQGTNDTLLGYKPSDDYHKVLRRKFQAVFGEPSWAKLDHKTPQDQDEDLAILRTCGNMLEKPTYLMKGILEAKRLASLNSETRNEGPIIKAVEFHPTSNVALVAGLSGVASIFQVDGRGNSKLASVQFDKFPVRCARFSTDGNQFIVGSQHHSHFYCYDMLQGTSIKIPTHHNMGMSNMKIFEVSPDGRLIAVAGRFGQIHLLTADSKEWISTLSMNGNVEAITFNSDGSKLYSHGELGEIYIWDMARRSFHGKFFDEGCLNGTAIALSPCGKYLATGSSSGIVNLYETNSIGQNESPKAIKVVENLVTPVSTVRFNPTSQILGIASDKKGNAIKMIHLPSATAFNNFPSLNAQLGKIQAFAFSPSSGYLSCANNNSTAFLFRLRHFGNY